MKIGDKLLCKSNYRYFADNRLIYKYDKWYEINGFVNDSYTNQILFIRLSGEKHISLDFSEHELNKYFYSIIELRKLKLEKLKKLGLES